MVEHPSPHDALYKKVFQEPANAAAILQLALPPALVASIRGLALEHGSFVDEALRYRHTDLLFRATLGGEDALVYFLLEHQSAVDRLMAARALRYVSRVIDAWLDGNPDADRIPAVITVVLFQGPGAWTGARSLSELVRMPRELESARPFTPELTIAVHELARPAHEAIAALAAPPIARIALMFLKCARDGDGVLGALEPARDLLREQVALPAGAEALIALWSYIYEITDRTLEDVRREVDRVIGAEVASTVKSLAQRLREEGLEEGIEKGIERGIERGIEKGIEKGIRQLVETQLCTKFGELPQAIRERLAAASSTDLERWGQRLLTAGRLQDVFADD